MIRLTRRVVVVASLLLLGTVGVGGLLVSRRGSAQVQLVTVPGRDSVELTVYNSVDLTFAKEQRNITLRTGTNLIQFSWAGTRIDPTSVQIASVSDPDAVQVLEAILPKHLENAILWRVESARAGAHVVEVSYFIQGLTWRAEYMAFVNSEETELRLLGNFLVSNASGEDFADVGARLVVGDIHLVDSQGLDAVMGSLRDADRRAGVPGRPAARRPVVKLVFSPLAVSSGKSLSEYYMYTVQGENTIDDGWSKKVNALDVASVPVSVVYRYEPGQDVVRRLYTFVNDEAHGLGGEPLPAGDVRVFMVDDQGQVSFVGQNRIEFTSVSKEVKLDLGPELAVEVESKHMDYAKMNLSFNDDGDVSHYDTEQEFKLDARNFRSESVRLELPVGLYGQWEMIRSTHEYERKDVNTIEYALDVGPGASEQVTYRYKVLGR